MYLASAALSYPIHPMPPTSTKASTTEAAEDQRRKAAIPAEAPSLPACSLTCPPLASPRPLSHKNRSKAATELNEQTRDIQRERERARRAARWREGEGARRNKLTLKPPLYRRLQRPWAPLGSPPPLTMVSHANPSPNRHQRMGTCGSVGPSRATPLFSFTVPDAIMQRHAFTTYHSLPSIITRGPLFRGPRIGRAALSTGKSCPRC